MKSDLKEQIIVEDELKIDALETFPAHVPLRDAVLKNLKKAILEGALKPGQLLSENKIAEKLSVSRTPVREAIHILEKEQLVTFLSGRKVIVSIPTIEDIKEVYDLRLIIESEALRRIDTDQTDLIQALEECVRLGEEYRRQKKLPAMARINTRFHLTIISALKNRRVEQFFDSLHETIARFRYYSLTNEWAIDRSKEHEQIVTCLKAGKKEKAVEALQRHLTISKANLMTLFTEHPSQNMDRK